MRHSTPKLNLAFRINPDNYLHTKMDSLDLEIQFVSVMKLLRLSFHLTLINKFLEKILMQLPLLTP